MEIEKLHVVAAGGAVRVAEQLASATADENLVLDPPAVRKDLRRRYSASHDVPHSSAIHLLFACALIRWLSISTRVEVAVAAEGCAGVRGGAAGR